MTTTATKTAKPKRERKVLPPKSETASRTANREKSQAARRRKFVVGDEVEFHLRDGQPRPQGDATILKIEPQEPSKVQQQMALLDVQCVVNGDPDKIRNPDGELWASLDELDEPGTRDACREEPHDQPADQQPAEQPAAEQPSQQAAAEPAGGQYVPGTFAQAGVPNLTRQQEAFVQRFRTADHVAVLPGTDSRVARSLKEKGLITVESDYARLTELGTKARGVLLGMPNADAVAVVPVSGESQAEPPAESAAEPRMQTARIGDVVVQLSAGAAKVLAGASDANVEPVTPLAQRDALMAAVQLLHNATGGRCDLIQLAGHTKDVARVRIVQAILGREPTTEDDVTVFGVRQLFRQAMEIEESLKGDAADERISQLAVQLMAANQSERQPADRQQAGSQQASSKPASKPAKTKTQQPAPAKTAEEVTSVETTAGTEPAEQVSTPAAGADQSDTNQPAAEGDFMTRTAERIRGGKSAKKAAAKRATAKTAGGSRGRKPGSKLILGAYAGAPFIRFLYRQGMEFEQVQEVLKGEGLDLPDTYVHSKLTKEHNKDWEPAEVTAEHLKELKAKYRSAFSKAAKK